MSIVDPLGQRKIRVSEAFKPDGVRTEVHLRGPENYDTAQSQDIFNVARRLKINAAPAEAKKSNISKRLLLFLGLGKKPDKSEAESRQQVINEFRARSSNRDFQRKRNPTHRKLPEEHVTEWRNAEEERRMISAGESPSQPRFKGPVPRRPSLPERERLSHIHHSAFLTPMETEVYRIMQTVGRCATFTPFTSSATSEDRRQQIMLVHPTNVSSLQHVQTLVAKLTDSEKHTMLRLLKEMLIPHLLSTLKILLSQPGIRITSSSHSGKGYSPEDETRNKPTSASRPTSSQFFTGWLNATRERLPISDGSSFRGRQRPQAESYKHKPSIFKSFEQRPFMPDSTNDTILEEERTLHLRGGGDSGRVYLSYFLKPDRPTALKDDERIPKALWWLCGGRVGSKKNVPTAGELRIRRRAELENRRIVGFMGTIIGMRAQGDHASNSAPPDDASGERPEPEPGPPPATVDPQHDDREGVVPVAEQEEQMSLACGSEADIIPVHKHGPVAELKLSDAAADVTTERPLAAQAAAAASDSRSRNQSRPNHVISDSIPEDSKPEVQVAWAHRATTTAIEHAPSAVDKVNSPDGSAAKIAAPTAEDEVLHPTAPGDADNEPIHAAELNSATTVAGDAAAGARDHVTPEQSAAGGGTNIPRRIEEKTNLASPVLLHTVFDEVPDVPTARGEDLEPREHAQVIQPSPEVKPTEDSDVDVLDTAKQGEESLPPVQPTAEAEVDSHIPDQVKGEARERAEQARLDFAHYTDGKKDEEAVIAGRDDEA